MCSWITQERSTKPHQMARTNRFVWLSGSFPMGSRSLKIGKLSPRNRALAWLSLDALYTFLWCDGDVLETRHAHQARCGTSRFGNELALGIMHINFRIFAGLGKLCGELRGLDDGAMGNVFACRITNDDMRAAIISRVQPEIVGARDFESKMVVVARGA